jgi:hypothetical protein
MLLRQRSARCSATDQDDLDLPLATSAISTGEIAALNHEVSVRGGRSQLHLTRLSCCICSDCIDTVHSLDDPVKARALVAVAFLAGR